MLYQRRKRLECMTENNDNKYSYYQNNYNLINNLINMNKKDMDYFRKINNNKASFITNKEGQILYVNDLWCKLCKFNTTDVIGHKFTIVQGRETNYEKCRKFCKELYTTGKSSMENINYDYEGNIMKVRITCRKIESELYLDNELPYFIGTTTLIE